MTRKITNTKEIIRTYPKVEKSLTANRQKEADRLDKLLQAVSQGDDAAWEELYKALFDSMHAFLTRIVRNKDDASDLAQEVFIYLWQHPEKIVPGKSIRSYLFTVARTQAFRLLRERVKLSGYISLEDGPTPDITDFAPDDILTAEETRLLIAVTTEAMSPQQKRAITLKIYEGLGNEDIAKEMGISVNTVRVHINNATREFRELLCFAAAFIAGGNMLS